MSDRSFAGLIADIELGKESLQRILGHQAEVLARADMEAAFFRISAAGVVLHDFYNAVEKTFQQIALEVDGGLPVGDAWHQQLLWRMTVAVPSLTARGYRFPISAFFSRVSAIPTPVSSHLRVRLGLGARRAIA